MSDSTIVDREKVDGSFIDTMGMKTVPRCMEVSRDGVGTGDVLIVTGDFGRHGMVIMSVRDLHCLRDLTRGGPGAILIRAGIADLQLGLATCLRCQTASWSQFPLRDRRKVQATNELRLAEY